jgi:hypothetical protein
MKCFNENNGAPARCQDRPCALPGLPGAGPAGDCMYIAITRCRSAGVMAANDCRTILPLTCTVALKY